jgi:hypothetical protein
MLIRLMVTETLPIFLTNEFHHLAGLCSLSLSFFSTSLGSCGLLFEMNFLQFRNFVDSFYPWTLLIITRI